MTLAETAKLAVQISLDDRLSSGMPRANRAISGLGSTARTVGKGIGIGLGVTAVAGIGLLTGALRKGEDALRDDAVIAAQTGAVIKSTGGKAHVTAQQVGDLADKLSDLNGVSDDVVQNTENILLTFTKISGKTLPRTTQAVLDMSAALGQDAKSGAIQLGKALNDPLKGITALSRVGVSFSAEQKKQIGDLIKHNKLRQAQAIILKEVETEFHGVAKAQADADPGRRLALNEEKFEKALAKGLLPVVEKVQKRLSEWLIKPETLHTVEKIGDAIGGLFTDENLDTVASGLETAANAVSTAIGAFNALPGPIKALAVGAFAVNKLTGGAVTGIASGLGSIIGKGISSIRANTVVVNANTVTGSGAGGGGGGAGSGKLGKALAAVSIATDIAAVIATQQEVSAQNSQLAKDIDANLQSGINVKTPAELQMALDGVNQGIKDIQSNPLNVLVSGDALTTLQSMSADLKSKLANGQLAGEMTSHPVAGGKPSSGATGFAGQIHILRQQLAEAKKEHNTRLEHKLSAEIKALKAAAHSAKAKAAADAAAMRTKQQASLIAFRAGERATHGVGTKVQRSTAAMNDVRHAVIGVRNTTSSKLNAANAKLDAIRHKKMHFTSNVKVNASTSVSVRNVNNSNKTQTRYSSKTMNQVL